MGCARLFTLFILAAMLALWFGPVPRRAAESAAFWVAWFVVAGAELWFLASMKRAYDAGEHPLPPRIALRAAGPPVARPLVAAWWLAHWASVVLLADYVYSGLQSPRARDDPNLLTINVGLQLVILFAGAYAANLYLLVAAGAATGSERLVRGLWSARFVLDLVIALVALLLPPLPRLPSPLG